MSDEVHQYAKYYEGMCVGDFVEVFSFPGASASVPAIVFRVKPAAVDVLAITRLGLEHRYDVWHEKDPRVESHRKMFGETGFADRGVFRPIEHRNVARMVDKLQAAIVELNSALHHLEQRIAELESKRKHSQER